MIRNNPTINAAQTLQSARKASIGSMAAARRAGSSDAASASNNTNAPANTRTSGSNGLTPNTSDCIKRETAAATDGVKQWRYKPTLLNGDPVEVDSTVSINFASEP